MGVIFQEIDGNLVTVNETIHSSGDDDNRAVFRIKVISVQPKKDAAADGDASSTVGPTTDGDGEREKTSTTIANADPSLNEIPNEAGAGTSGTGIDPGLDQIPPEK